MRNFGPLGGALVLLEGVGELLIVGLIDLGVGSTSDLLSGLFTVEQGSGLLERAVLGFNDI